MVTESILTVRRESEGFSTSRYPRTLNSCRRGQRPTQNRRPTPPQQERFEIRYGASTTRSVIGRSATTLSKILVIEGLRGRLTRFQTLLIDLPPQDLWDIDTLARAVL